MRIIDSVGCRKKQNLNPISGKIFLRNLFTMVAAADADAAAFAYHAYI